MKKKILAIVGTVGAFGPVLAEGGESVDPSTLLTQAKTALEGLMNTGLPIVGGILVIGLGVWGAFKLVRLIMKSFGFGSSR